MSSDGRWHTEYLTEITINPRKAPLRLSSGFIFAARGSSPANNGTLSAKALERRSYEDLLRSCRNELARLQQHNDQLAANG